MYNDNKAVRVMDQEVGHIKPKQVYMVVYARRDGGASWRRSAGSGSVPEELGAGLGYGAPVSVGGSGGSGNVGPVSSSLGGGLPGARSSVAVVCAGSPRKRRLTRKASVCAEDTAASPAGTATPERKVKAARLDVMTSAGGGSDPVMCPGAVGSPRSGRRRLARKTSEAEGAHSGPALGAAPEVEGAPLASLGAAGSPDSGRRRLRRKTSEVADVPCAPGPEGAPRAGAIIGARASPNALGGNGGHDVSVAGAGRRPVGRRIPVGVRIVSGFGGERVEDVVARDQRVEAEALARAARRREDGSRGRMVGFGGEDLDRARGGAWQAGHR